MDIDPEMEASLRRRAKAVLRQRARALRNTIPLEKIAERSSRIAEALEGLPAFAQARSVAVFAAIEGRNEVDLAALGARLRSRGTAVAYPSIDPETRIMTFRYPRDPDAMQERGLGFCEPSPEEPEAFVLDAIVVPALQIDPTGHRIGVAFDFQLIPEVPFTENDVAVDWVVTDTRVLDPRAPLGVDSSRRDRRSPG